MLLPLQPAFMPAHVHAYAKALQQCIELQLLEVQVDPRVTLLSAFAWIAIWFDAAAFLTKTAHLDCSTLCCNVAAATVSVSWTFLLHRRGAITEALGGELEFEFFHWWFNSIFLACACLTMLLFYGQYKQRVQDTDQLPIYYHTSREWPRLAVHCAHAKGCLSFSACPLLWTKTSAAATQCQSCIDTLLHYHG